MIYIGHNTNGVHKSTWKSIQSCIEYVVTTELCMWPWPALGDSLREIFWILKRRVPGVPVFQRVRDWQRSCSSYLWQESWGCIEAWPYVCVHVLLMELLVSWKPCSKVSVQGKSDHVACEVLLRVRTSQEIKLIHCRRLSLFHKQFVSKSVRSLQVKLAFSNVRDQTDCWRHERATDCFRSGILEIEWFGVTYIHPCVPMEGHSGTRENPGCVAHMLAASWKLVNVTLSSMCTRARCSLQLLGWRYLQAGTQDAAVPLTASAFFQK